jgi:hypothetical protein
MVGRASPGAIDRIPRLWQVVVYSWLFLLQYPGVQEETDTELLIDVKHTSTVAVLPSTTYPCFEALVLESWFRKQVSFFQRSTLPLHKDCVSF